MAETPLYLPPEEIKTVAVVGAGSVGASWTALFLAAGLEVVAHDPAPDAEIRARSFVADAWPALVALGMARTAEVPGGQLRFVATATAAAEAADLVQENAPEKPELKSALLAELDAAAGAHQIIISSTGGIPPSQLQRACRRPERFVVVHPFNPTHLIPLVEIVGGEQTAPAVVEWAMEFARRLGKYPIRLRREATGHMTNRLQFALLREAVHCLNEGIASAEDIDAAVRYGLGPRWALMGSLLTLHLAGGPGGMAGILDHAGDAIEGWWQALGQPELDAEVRRKLVVAAEEISGGHSVAEWVQWRDENLVRLLELLQDRSVER